MVGRNRNKALKEKDKKLQNSRDLEMKNKLKLKTSYAATHR